MQCKSLWIKASAKCINVNVINSLSLKQSYHLASEDMEYSVGTWSCVDHIYDMFMLLFLWGSRSPMVRESDMGGVNDQHYLTLNTRLRWDPWARLRTSNCFPGGAEKMAAQCFGCVFTVCVRVCLFTTHCWMGEKQSTNSWPRHIRGISELDTHGLHLLSGQNIF